MATRRKLFLTHAGELAHLLLRDVERDGLVAQFVRAYAERHGRRGLLNDPARLPELQSTIGREALLVMAADVRRMLSQEFESASKGARRPEDAAFAGAFYAEFLSALTRGLGWPPSESDGEAGMFRRDLEMYRRWGERPAPAASVARVGEHQSPFRDRCALLLDPAMMEQARRAAADFEDEILRVAARRFRQLGRSSLVVTRAPRRPARKPPRRKKRAKPLRKVGSGKGKPALKLKIVKSARPNRRKPPRPEPTRR